MKVSQCSFSFELLGKQALENIVEVYIVYLGLNRIRDPNLTYRYHLKLLSSVFGSEKEAECAILYSYKYSFSGFSALLEQNQVRILENLKEVVSIFRSQSSQSSTTRSWDFLGLTLDDSEVTPSQLSYGDDIIVGVLDTGVWPESESFQEDGSMSPCPLKWKGECVEGQEFEPANHCNQKLIGARYYLKGFEIENGMLNATEEYRSARDYVGHGTHTASTAVGSIVENANFFGLAKGIARGGAPRARLAVYKVCWNIDLTGVCSEADILAAFDDALHDGVHIISVSFGPMPPLIPFFKESASIGSFHAMQMGVTVVFSAGNNDVSPEPSLVGNVAPWSICVAASSVDRTFPTKISIADKLYVVLPDVTDVPTVLVNLEQGTQIKRLLAESRYLPKVQIKGSRTVIGKSPAPVVAYFSSRGPSSLTPDILKPDLSAPGVNILAAWPPKTPPSSIKGDTRSVCWNFQSGTSMSCPHVSGVAALIKSAHPNWSPAAIRSALITTAHTLDSTFDSILGGGSMKVADPFDIGAGHINPSKAIDPGLIYDMKPSDYIIFLCNIGFNQDQITRVILPPPGTERSCQRFATKTNSYLNYPSITVSNLRSTMTIKKTVRNVGKNKNAIYFATIVAPCGVEVEIWPKVLIFSWFREENSFYVTLKPVKESQGRYDFGEIVWSDGLHFVRSPLVVRVNTTSAYDSGGLKHSF
ncbi:hypothetical protein L6164_025216 [Bauhinia variegata]|uniref:Uncharacterized protein n=1 Tax=Bauhinia variegata TaxID=167791 RepID=A0ACB9M1B1_BAUVA|nr:hypothetical protein L6164_025216 [Bauhinia variegata]